MSFFNIRALLILITFLVPFLFIQSACAVDIFLTSDCISGNATLDQENLKSIKNYIENGTLKGKVNVTIDPKAPKPGEAYRALTQGKKNGVSVYLAAACAGTIISTSKSASKTSKGIIYVNTGKTNLKNAYILPRAWDDNFSNYYFAGIKYPYKLLRGAGVRVIQPNVDCNYTDQDLKNQYIAHAISQLILTDKTLTSKKGRTYQSSLVLYHKLSPSVLAKASQGILASYNKNQSLKSSYNGYTINKYLLMASEYLQGYSLKKPSYMVRGPSNPNVNSTYMGTLNYSECRAISTLVSNYIHKYHQSPSYVTYKNQTIGYRDLILMYAYLTAKHTSKYTMTLPKYYNFRKYRR